MPLCACVFCMCMCVCAYECLHVCVCSRVCALVCMCAIESATPPGFPSQKIEFLYQGHSFLLQNRFVILGLARF